MGGAWKQGYDLQLFKGKNLHTGIVTFVDLLIFAGCTLVAWFSKRVGFLDSILNSVASK